MLSKGSLPGNPRKSNGAEDRERQHRALTEPVRSSRVTVSYVDAKLGIADAQDSDGRLVSLNNSTIVNNSTVGVDLGKLEVGMELVASITRFQYAVKVTFVVG